MNSVQRAFKKLVIALIAFGAIGIIALIIFWPDKPLCENGILDEGEEQVDCGGFCADQHPAKAAVGALVQAAPLEVQPPAGPANLIVLRRIAREVFEVEDGAEQL